MSAVNGATSPDWLTMLEAYGAALDPFAADNSAQQIITGYYSGVANDQNKAVCQQFLNNIATLPQAQRIQAAKSFFAKISNQAGKTVSTCEQVGALAAQSVNSAGKTLQPSDPAGIWLTIGLGTLVLLLGFAIAGG